MDKLKIVVLLALSPFAFAQEFNMPKQQWLGRLKPIVSDGFCNGAGSPFKQIYHGSAESCVADVEKLFDQCATNEPAVVLPDAITSIPQANWYGQVMAECVSAHYQGGVALETFRALQRVAMPPHEGG